MGQTPPKSYFLDTLTFSCVNCSHHYSIAYIIAYVLLPT